MARPFENHAHQRVPPFQQRLILLGAQRGQLPFKLFFDGATFAMEVPFRLLLCLREALRNVSLRVCLRFATDGLSLLLRVSQQRFA
jgi:hypothetical protein